MLEVNAFANIDSQYSVVWFAWISYEIIIDTDYLIFTFCSMFLILNCNHARGQSLSRPYWFESYFNWEIVLSLSIKLVISFDKQSDASGLTRLQSKHELVLPHTYIHTHI